MPNVRSGPRTIDTSDWEALDRNIVGSFLGYLSMESYDRGGFICSALVVGKRDGSPGEGFYSLLKDLGLIANSKSDKALYIWSDHVSKAHQWYANNPDAVA